MSQSTSSSTPTATSTPTASTGSLRVAASRFLWNKILRRKSNALSSIPAQCRVPLGSNKVSGTALGWEQGKVRGQVGGWLYIAYGRTGGLGSDDTRAGRAGRAGSNGGSDWWGTGSD